MVNNTMIGALRVEATLESGKFVDGAKKIKSAANDVERSAKKSFDGIANSADRAGKSFGGLGTAFKAGLAGFASAISIGLLTQAISKSLEYAQGLKAVSGQLNVSTRDLQTFRYAAEQSGIKQQQLDDSLGNLKETLGKVAAGAAAPTKALAAIGIAAADLRGKDTGEALRMIADGLKGIQDPAGRAAVEMAIFGENGAKLDTLLAGGSAAINELSDAAERLGIVLSDDQIQRADETAQKLDDLKAVLSAKIAGVVADNANAILGLADALLAVVSAAGQAIAALQAFYHTKNAQVWDSIAHAPFQSSDARQNARRNAFRERLAAGPMGRSEGLGGSRPVSGGTVPQFLAPRPRGGGGRRRSARAARDTSLRDGFEFANDLRRADMDILRAKQSLATDYSERYALSIQILNLEKEGYEAELAYKVKAGELTKAQADQLKVKFDQVDALKRQAEIDEEEAQRKEDYNRLSMLDFDLQREHLERQRSLSETAAERRDVELRILDLAYQQEKLRLQTILADEKSTYAAQEEARSRLEALNRNYSLDRQGVMNATRGPWEEYLASLPTTAAKANEALERLQVEGFEGLIDAAMELQHGFESAGKALLQTLRNFFLGIARMELQKGLGSILGGSSPLGGLFGSISGGFGSGSTGTGAMSAVDFATPGMGSLSVPGFATGGAFNILGRHGADRNILQLNGLPIARVSHGERISVSNGGAGGGRSLVQNFTFPNSDFDSFKRSQTQAARLARRNIGPR